MKVREQVLDILEKSDGGLTAEQICEKGDFSGRTVVSRARKQGLTGVSFCAKLVGILAQ